MKTVGWTIIKYYGWQCPECDEWNETHEGKIADERGVVFNNLKVTCEKCEVLFELEL